jgi:hypothetical protein
VSGLCAVRNSAGARNERGVISRLGRRAGVRVAFLANNSEFAGRGDAEADAVAGNIEHDNLDVTADHHDLARAAGQNEHVHCLLRSTL